MSRRIDRYCQGGPKKWKKKKKQRKTARGSKKKKKPRERVRKTEGKGDKLGGGDPSMENRGGENPKKGGVLGVLWTSRKH